jgi:hypothetical protein
LRKKLHAMHRMSGSDEIDVTIVGGEAGGVIALAYARQAVAGTPEAG